MAMALLLALSSRCHAEAALLMEEPYGFFGTVNPTGHTAVYFDRICAETPVRLRRCEPGETGVVISRYQGIGSYDWVAIPLIPYLYSVEKPEQVPDHVDRATVERLRERYHEQHLMDLGDNISPGNILHGGWTQLVGVSYERRIYAFRFNTSEEQDDALIAWLNDRTNKSHFELLFNNCADFARVLLNQYFPGKFARSIFPDAGMTTPKQITYKLMRYSKKHPETEIEVFEIPQVPGYRHLSRANKSVSESLVTTVYAVPLAIVNPYLAGGLFVDYLVRGRYHLIPKEPQVLGPETLNVLTGVPGSDENAVNAATQAPGAATGGTVPAPPSLPANSGLQEISTSHE